MKHITWLILITFFINLPIFSQTTNDTICILQLNDVYEIGPLSGGKIGGMARVATLVKQAEARYQTFVVLAGDFVSPSVIGTTRIDGRRTNGRHMIDIMNRAGLDLVTFGNHEFDIPDADLQQRINESNFTWLSSDVMHKDTNGTIRPYYKTLPDSVPLPTSFLLPSTHGQFTIGIVSATVPSNLQSWVQYNDQLRSLKKALKQVKRQSNVVIGLTHLALARDEAVLRKLKKIRLIMGGHEHKNSYVTIGKGTVAKADANAKSMYQHLIFREGGKGKIKILSELVEVDSTVIPDPVLAAAVKDWENRAYASFRAVGLEPDEVVYRTKEPLDGTEASMRYKQTNLGRLIAQAMLDVSPQSEAAVFNSGSVRIDDMIDGVLTQLDVIRALPFGGKLCEVKLTGELLHQMLDKGNYLEGLGGYLQVSANLQPDSVNNTWLLNNIPLDSAKIYTIISPEYLFTGLEKGLEFLKDGNPEIRSVQCFDAQGDLRSDIRLAVVGYLKKHDNQ